MTAFVIDASTIPPFTFADEAERLSEDQRGFIVQADLHAPAHWPFEVANILLIAQRRGRIGDEHVVRTVSFLRDLDVELDLESQRQAWSVSLDLAFTDGLTVYDAAYLELARRKGYGLLTLDGPLSRAARARGIETPLLP